MALQGDGNGIVTIPSAVASDGFSLEFSSITLTAGLEIIIGDNSSSQHFVAIFETADVAARVNSGTLPSYNGSVAEVIKYKISRPNGSNIVTVEINDVIFSNTNAAGSFSLNTIFTYNGGLIKGTMLLSGTMTMSGFTGAGDRSYNFEGSGTTLVDTISGENGTLSGFTTGGFTAPVTDSISITSVVDNESRQRNVSSQAVFVISGDIVGTATSVEYQIDAGAWTVLDASPTTTFSGSVTITNQQDLSVRWSNNTSVNDSVLKLKAAMCIAVGPAQSNAANTLTNAQAITVGAGKPTPAMYKDGVFSALADPTATNGVGNGSLWVAIAQHYSDLGIPVCFGNVAVGGTKISDWNLVGTNYGRLLTFADKCGGLDFAITIIGESDSSAGTSTASFKSTYGIVTGDINTQYGCDVYAVYFPVGTATGTTPNVDAIRLAYDELISENSFIKFGGDLSVIDISSATNPVNDNLHIKTDADAATASTIIWNALTGTTSTLNLVATGYPDGAYSAEFYQATSPLIHIKTENVTFSSGTSSAIIPLAVGTTVYTRIDGATPPSTGVTCYGVTV